MSGDIDFPELTIVGLVDEEQFVYFDSNTKKVVPKTEWIKQNEGADYWDTQTQLAAGTHHAFRNNIQVAKDRFNHSTGIINIHKIQTQITIVLLVLECYVLHLAPKSRKSQEKEKEKSLYSMRL